MRLPFAAFLCLATTIAFSQTSTIKGVLHNRGNQVINFVYTEDPIRGYINVGTVKTDEGGNFLFSFAPVEMRPIQLNYNVSKDKDKPKDFMYTLWIEPGKQLSIDVQQDTLISYAGDCVKENNLLKQVQLHSWSHYTDRYDMTDFRFSALEASMAPVKKERMLILNQAFSRGGYTSAFRHFIGAEVFFEDFRSKLRYLIEYTSQKEIAIRTYKVPEAFQRFLNSVNFFDDQAFYSLKFRNGLREYFDYLSTTTLKAGESYTLHTFRLLDQKLGKLPRTHEYLKAYFLKFAFNYEQNLDSLQTAVALLEQQNPGSPSLPYFTKKVNEKIGLLYAKKTLPDIVLTDTSGQKVSLKQLEGKVLLIDFWGSWCKPCMEQMPYSKKLEEALRGKNVLFVYINNPTDSDAKWKATVQKLGIHGLQLKADDAAQKQLYDYYVFTNYPYYVVTNAKGTPQNIEGGVRPSTNAREVLEGLLQ